MWPPVVFLIIAIVAVGLLVLVAMILNGKRGPSFDVQDYQTRWLKIENSLAKGDPRSYSLAIMDADKLLDRALKEIGLAGKTMGERMKKINDRFSDANRVWYAHKIRNQLAHEQDFDIDYTTASRALAAYRQALKDLGAI